MELYTTPTGFHDVATLLWYVFRGATPDATSPETRFEASLTPHRITYGVVVEGAGFVYDTSEGGTFAVAGAISSITYDGVKLFDGLGADISEFDVLGEVPTHQASFDWLAERIGNEDFTYDGSAAPFSFFKIPGTGDHTILGSEGADSVEGMDGIDELRGAGGDDFLHGNDGDDLIFGGAGNDTLPGADGDDVIRGGDDADSLMGGDGADSLYGNDGADTLLAGFGDDYLAGGRKADYLNGVDGDDVLRGGNGRDTLIGHNDDDKLYGEAGRDLLVGGPGTDKMWGGEDRDRFLWQPNHERTVVKDFTAEDKLIVYGFGGVSGFKDLMSFAIDNDAGLKFVIGENVLLLAGLDADDLDHTMVRFPDEFAI